MQMNVTFKTDGDGFISQQCPSCGRRFKVLYGQGSSEPVSWCPYCRHRDTNWMTPEQREFIAGQAKDQFIMPELKKMADKINRGSKGSGFKMKAEITPGRTPPAPAEPDDPSLITIDALCCGENFKIVAGTVGAPACIICGALVSG